jgi:EpsI family protein
MILARRFVPGLLFAVGALLTARVEEQKSAPLATPLASLPLELGGYTGRERGMSEGEVAVAGVSDYVFRIFGPDSAPAFSLYIGYYDRQVKGRTIHSPRNCLPGAGWQTVEFAAVPLLIADRQVTVNRYVLAKGASQALVYYWYQGRGRVAHDEYRVKWDLLADAMRYGRSEEALVRVVVPLPRPGRLGTSWRERMAAAEEIARRAAVEIIPQLDAALPSWPPPSRS